MLYHIRGKLAQTSLLSASHGEFRDLVQKVVRPSLCLLQQFQREGKIVVGGAVACAPDLVLILELPPSTSHIEVRRLLLQLPIFGYYVWEVNPLESFQDWEISLSGPG